MGVGDPLERAQPEAFGALEDLQAALDKQAIFPQHRHEIGHRPQGHQVEQFVEIAAAFFAGEKGFAEGLHQLEGDADASQALERIAAIAAIGIDDGKGARQFGELLVVIDYDDFHAVRRGQFQGVVGRNTIVNRDDDARPHCDSALDPGRLETVSVLVAIG